MPTLNTYNTVTSDVGATWFDGRKIYYIDPNKKVATVYDVVDKSYWTASVTLPSQITGTPGYRALLVDAGKKPNGMWLDVAFTTDQQEAVRVIFDFDNSAKSVSSELIWRITSPNVANQWTFESTIIYPKLWILMPYDYATVSYIDLDNGNIVTSFDSGLGSYGPRVDKVVVVKADDIYVLAGRHYSGDPFRYLKVYSKTFTTIPNSTVGGDSPHASTSTIVDLRKRLLFIASGSSVLNSQPPLLWFDRDLNVIGSTPLTSIYQYARHYGLIFLGVNSAGNYVLLANIWNNTWNYETDNGVYAIEVNPSNYSIVSSTKFSTFKWWWDAGSQSGKYYTMPIFDKNKKKVYTTAKDRYSTSLALVEIDVSDINIAEWNNWAHEVGVFKTPVNLSLRYALI